MSLGLAISRILLPSQMSTEKRWLLECLQRGEKPRDESPDDISESALNRLSVKNFPELRRACAKLQVKTKDPKLDVFFRARITAMAGTLNLYLDPKMSYTWHQASLVVSMSQGHGVSHARNICTWIHRFLGLGKLPLHRYGRFQSCILEDEDFAQDIQLHLLEISKDKNLVKDCPEVVKEAELEIQKEEEWNVY